jgi:predicted  nucleic acid-binding Zn-ribbon protein
MPTRRALNERLDQLRSELASSSLSAGERARLEKLIGDVREHIEQERLEPQSLADRLQEAIAEFEETHPRLTLAIGSVADALARLGI